MALSSFTVTIITKSDSPFNVIPNAPIEIRERLANGSSGNLSLIFSDSAGLNPITQVGFAANSLGQATFFAAAADYNAVYDNNGTPVTIAVDVGVTGGILNERFDRLNPATLSDWQADTSAQLKDVVTTKERTAGNGAGADYDTVAKDTFPVDAFHINHNTLLLQLSQREIEKTSTFANVGELRGEDLQPIQTAKTQGRNASKDGGAATYVIVTGASPDDNISPNLDNGNHAQLIDGKTISQFNDNITAAVNYGKANGQKISLEDREISGFSVSDDHYDWLFGGFIDIANILYPINIWGFTKSIIMTQDQGPELNYNSWPQGKVYKEPHQPGGNGESKLKILINRGSSHQASDLTVWSMESQDYFNTLSEPMLESGKVNFSQGNTCWSAGTDRDRQYFITRERGANFNIGTSRHFLNFATTPETVGGYARKLIDFDNGTEVPILYHSFAKLGNGKLAVGYEFTNGEVGLAFTDSDSTVGDTWTNVVMFAGTGSLILVEPSLFYDATNTALVGFLRTESFADPAQFYVSLDDGLTFSFSDVTDVPIGAQVGSPINVAKANGKYYAFVTERIGDARMFLLIAGAGDAIANGFSAFKKYFIGNSRFSGVGGSGAGAGDIYADDNKVIVFYGEHGNTNEVVNIVKMDIDFSKRSESSTDFSDKMSTNVLPKEMKFDLTPLLEAQWSAEDSGEGVAVNGGGLFAYKRGAKLRIVGYLKTTDATAAIITLPQSLHPWASHKPAASHSDTTFAVNLFRGVLTGGVSGELRLLNETGALDKVMIDFEVDMLR